MSWKKELLKSFKLYAITDLCEENLDILSKIDEALRGGVDIIQLRAKSVSDKFLYSLGRKIRSITNRRKKLFIVNDRIDLMMALDADGVHLGQDDLPIELAREIIKNRSKIIGRSTHSVKQAFEAVRQGADYIGFGPVFSTPTKPTYQPIGLSDIKKVVEKIEIPVVCIGGIDRSNVYQVIQAGAKRVAVVRAIFAAPNKYEAAKELKGLIK